MTAYRLHFDNYPSAMCYVPQNVSIDDHLYYNPPSIPGDTSLDYLVIDLLPATTNSNTEDNNIIDVHVSKNPERNVLRKRDALKARQNENFIANFAGRFNKLEEEYERSRRADLRRISHLENDREIDRYWISLLEEKQELDDTFFETELAEQHILLQFETFSRILRSLNDKILREVHQKMSNPKFELLSGINYMDKILVNATGALEKRYSNMEFKKVMEKLVKDSAVYLVLGTRPFGVLVETGDSDPPDLYAKKLLRFLSDKELRLALQLFTILNSSNHMIHDNRNKTIHLRPSRIHAAKCVTLIAASVTEFETEVALQIIDENEPFSDAAATLPFGEFEANEGLQHSLTSRVEESRFLKRSREGVE
ncbi:hypothetical protein BT96DRAFT_1026090 [Gymnopus androsaceus JB14]|uniref:Uncharacterized protein n=1 Tax=Gymnopus androsaceus JB14 TaxID=1447944 RepID=A0A6A4GND1_9AGAR|nr:hypothetical protein BT96DRAFT_1026090 [Gymnopus androsaceus JB14]